MINKSPYLIVALVGTVRGRSKASYTAQRTAVVSIVYKQENVHISADIDETSAAVKSSSIPLLSAVETVFSGRKTCCKLAIRRVERSVRSYHIRLDREIVLFLQLLTNFSPNFRVRTY